MFKFLNITQLFLNTTKYFYIKRFQTKIMLLSEECAHIFSAVAMQLAGVPIKDPLVTHGQTADIEQKH